MQTPLLLYASVSFIALSIARWKHAIGGWLLYFYFWIFALLYISLRDVVLHPRVFMPAHRSLSVNHEALVLAVFPRLFVYLAVATLAVILLIRSEWVWVERLRVGLLAGAVIAGISVWLDFRYFPTSTLPNIGRWIGLCFWLVYFFVSVRVRRVFQTKDWGIEGDTGRFGSAAS